MSASATANAAAKPAHTSIVVEECEPRRSNTLRAFVKIALPSGMILSDVSVHISGGRAWASPASKPMIDRNGVALREADGKIKYAPIVTFATKALRDRFSDAVIEAVRLSHPAVLAEDAA